MSLSAYIDLAILAIPFIIAIVLIIKFLVPKNPKMGILLAGATGLLGAFLVKRRLNNIFAVEDKIAQFNDNMKEFKQKQKNRSEAVLANNAAKEILQQKRAELAKKGEKHKTEIDLLDKEIEERSDLNKKLMDDTSSFLARSESRSAARKALLGDTSSTESIEMQSAPEIAPREKSLPQITLDGFQLTEV